MKKIRDTEKVGKLWNGSLATTFFFYHFVCLTKGSFIDYTLHENNI